MPLENVILHLKAAGIKDVLSFPFPTRPAYSSLLKSLNNLKRIGALDFREEKDLEELDSELNKIKNRLEI
jgi:HrpA-like RNA helicase